MLRRLSPWALLMVATGCGKDERSEEPAPDPSSVPGDPSEVETESTLPSPEEAAAMCRATCEAAEPTVSDDICRNQTIDVCIDTCLGSLEDLDRTCAACILREVDWEAPQSSCNDSGCVCTGGSPTFNGDPCVVECAANEARLAFERLSAPVPEPEGHLPASTYALAEFIPGALAFDGEQNLWAVGEFPDRSGAHLVMLEPDGTPRYWSASDTGVSLEDVRLFTDGSQFLLVTEDSDGEGKLGFLSTDQEFVWTREVEPMGTVHSLMLGTTPDWGGNARITTPQGEPRPFAFLDESACFTLDTEGDAEEFSALPEASSGGTHRAYALDSLGRIWAATTPSGSPQPSLIGVYDPASSLEAPALELTVAGNQGAGEIFEMRADSDGGMYIAGLLGTDYSLIDPGVEALYSTPFVGHVSAAGVLDFAFFDSTRVIEDSTLEDFVWDEAGNVYLLTTEDPIDQNLPPEERDALCSVYGCRNLTLRKISPSGTLVWSYEHRATSKGLGLALSDENTLVVSGWLEREVRYGLLLYFAL